ncbi:MAG: universal stress protein [Cyclobacteriaceae bacterium]
MKSIIVPIDFSACSFNALRYAIDLSKNEETEILLLHAVDYPVPMGMEYGMVNGSVMGEQLIQAEQKAEKKLEVLTAQQKEEKITFSKRTVTGSLMNWLKTDLPEMTCDLIVMGTTGASELKSTFIGSNTEKVVRHACCPVLAVPKEASWKPIVDIVVPFESKELTESFFTSLREIQGFTDATIQLLWVNTPHAIVREADLIEEMAAFVNSHGITDYRINTRRAFSPAAGILSFLEEVNGDLVAMSTHGRKGLQHLIFDSVTEEVVNKTAVPIWAFRAPVKEKVKA